MMGTDVIIIDPENEYKHLSDAVGGTYISVSLSSENKINPLICRARLAATRNRVTLSAVPLLLLRVYCG